MEDFKVNNFDFEKEYENIRKSINKPNILLCGATGVGKSSVINYIFGKSLAKVAAGEPVTRGVHKYEDEDTSVILYDSEGYEIGSEKISYFKENVINIIDKKKENSTSMKEHIHLVWYCISAANKRITDLDIETINDIQNKGVNVGVLLTQIDSTDEDELNGLIDTLNQEIRNIDYFRVSIDEDVPEEYLDWDKLIDWSINNLDETLRSGFIKSLDRALDKKKKFINTKIVPGYGVTAAGIAATPVPLSDAAILLPMQTGMCMNILYLWGIDQYKGMVEGVMSSAIISQAGKYVAKTLTGNLVKLIPGAGSLIGGSINAAVASSFTIALGYAVSELSYKYVVAVKEGKNVDIFDIFTNDAIVNLIKENLKLHKKGASNE